MRNSTMEYKVNQAYEELKRLIQWNPNSEEKFLHEIVKALGGIDNIKNIDACITRLRVTVKDETIVLDDEKWKEINAKGVIRSGKGIQIIYGTQAEIYKNKIRSMYSI